MIQAHNPEVTVVPVTRIQVSSLWQASFNICQDPVHGGSHLGPTAVHDSTSFDWTEFKIKLLEFHDVLLRQKRSIEDRICTRIVERLRNFTIHDFIRIHSTLGANQNQVVSVYQEISTMTYIFSILDSDGAKKCCLENPLVYSNLSTRVLPEVYYMVSGYIRGWHRHSCTKRLTAMVHDQLTCEEVQNLILLVYNDIAAARAPIHAFLEFLLPALPQLNDLLKTVWIKIRRHRACSLILDLHCPNQVVSVYQEISTMTYIFSILDSDGAKKCCLENPLVYSNLSTRVLPEVYYMVSGYIRGWHRHSCTKRLTAMVHDQLTCEEVQNLILLVCKYGMHQSRVIWQQV